MRQGHSTVNYLNSLPEHTYAIRENLYEGSWTHLVCLLAFYQHLSRPLHRMIKAV